MNIIVASPSVSFYQLVCVEGALPPEERNQVSYLSHFVDFVTFLIGNIIIFFLLHLQPLNIYTRPNY
jgi:hypothetical protein